MLLLNQSTSVHTVREEASPWTGYYYDTFAIGPLLVPTKHSLVLGMGAGGCIQSIRAVNLTSLIDAVEIDPKVVEAAVRWFGVDPSDSRLRIHTEDARPWLLNNRDTYDLIQVDLYQGGPYIPFYLIREEFFRLIRAHITSHGVVMMNVFDASAKRELVTSAAATLRRAFTSVMAVKGLGANYMLLGFAERRTVDEVRHQFKDAGLSERLRDIVRLSMSALSDFPSPDGTLVFTDDRAPVEGITRRMLTEYRGNAYRE